MRSELHCSLQNSHTSRYNENGFLWDLGAEWKGTSEMAGGDYLLAIEALRPHNIDDPLFMYVPSQRIAVADGESLGNARPPDDRDQLRRLRSTETGHLEVRPSLCGGRRAAR